MSKEQAGWHDQLQTLRDTIEPPQPAQSEIPEDPSAQSPTPTEENDTSQPDQTLLISEGYRLYFEESLEYLKQTRKIRDWKRTRKPDRKNGITHTVLTNQGEVPFAQHSSHEKAKKKRRSREELHSTTIAVLYKRHAKLKPPETINMEILMGIDAYWENQEKRA
ncbi:MAG: hypothetical protein A2785_03290 [Candidatus Chisholmbacteria bacterium RIFCSPHIGHO2_01_FULL_49_18]|uniref:Uncharacterized protein n=1 Tax=Candidatus Chisholmbacteria bacterium RIFCSPHIGHO2_01_FULL_49_18 TaxID=1797590 RepID=A0A1G1VMH8_9BACT|nr:MAG: hypothetical protein A2785_03290 [Candidatus Chisholmbacteria bacterium RIFCSPHIGHO2_01_FULL_49_18]